MPKIENRSFIGLGFREVCSEHKAALTLFVLITGALIGYAIKGNLTHLEMKKIDTDLGRGLSAAGIGLLALGISSCAFYKIGKKTPEGLAKMREKLLKQERALVEQQRTIDFNKTAYIADHVLDSDQVELAKFQASIDALNQPITKVRAKLKAIEDKLKRQIRACGQDQLDAPSVIDLEGDDDQAPAPVKELTKRERAIEDARIHANKARDVRLRAQEAEAAREDAETVRSLQDQAAGLEKLAAILEHQAKVATIEEELEALGHEDPPFSIEAFILLNTRAEWLTVAEACNPLPELTTLFSLAEQFRALEAEIKTLQLQGAEDPNSPMNSSWDAKRKQRESLLDQMEAARGKYFNAKRTDLAKRRDIALSKYEISKSYDASPRSSKDDSRDSDGSFIICDNDN